MKPTFWWISRVQCRAMGATYIVTFPVAKRIVDGKTYFLDEPSKWHFTIGERYQDELGFTCRNISSQNCPNGEWITTNTTFILERGMWDIK